MSKNNFFSSRKQLNVVPMTHGTRLRHFLFFTYGVDFARIQWMGDSDRGQEDGSEM